MTDTDLNADLADRYGTPLYVYDLDRVAAARRDLFAALPDGVEVYYAFKANPHPDLARALREDDGTGHACRAEISSTGELAAAVTAGYDPASCLYTGPGKTPGELAAAIDAGVRTFSVESLSDLRHVGEAALAHGTTARCLLRVNSATASASTGIRMTGRPSQFGIDGEMLPALMPELAAVPGTRLVGAHYFTMSNAKDEDHLVTELEAAISSAAKFAEETGLPLELLDIGGGFAAPYATPGERPRYGRLRGELERALDLYLPGWRSGAPRIAVESGRYLVADSGRLLTRVVNVKDSRGSRFVIADAGINTVGGLSGLGRLLPAAVRPDTAAPEAEPASLVGPLCTPGDLLARDIGLPAAEPGDLLSIPNVGAYGPTASLLGFLSRPAPVEAVVRGTDVVTVSRLELHRVPQAPHGGHG